MHSLRKSIPLYWNLPFTTVTDSNLAERDASADTIFIRPCPSVPFTHTPTQDHGIIKRLVLFKRKGWGMVDTHCPTKPVTRVNPAMIGSSLNNQDGTYLSRAHPPAVNHNQGHYKTGDSKTKLMQRERLNAQSATGEKLWVMEKKIGMLLPD